jgi:hypothetical protein
MLTLAHLETMLRLTHDSCTVCAEHTTSSKIILDAPMVLLGDMGHVESRFGPFGDNVSVSAR